MIGQSTRAVDLRDDARRASRPRVGGLPPDLLRQRVPQPARRHQEVVEPHRPRVAGQEVEDLRQVLAEGLAAGEQAEVRVDAAGPRVVVARREVAVAADAVRLLADHEAGLAVGLVTHQAVDDVGPHLLERPGPADVGLLVEPGLELHQHRDLLSGLGGDGQRLGDGRGRADPVERHVDGQHLGSVGRLLDEAGHHVEGLVGVVDEDVAGLDRAARRRALGEGRHRVGRPAAGP